MTEPVDSGLGLDDDSDGALEAERSAATQVASPAARRMLDEQRTSSSSSAPSVPATKSTASADGYAGTSTTTDAMFREEVARTRVFAQLAFVLCLIVIGGLPLLPGDATVRTVLMIALGGCAVQCVWVYFAFRDPSRYRASTVTWLGTYAAVAVYIGIFYWGTFSVAPALVVLGIYFFGRSQSLRSSLFIYGLIAVMQGGLAIAILSDAVVDPGLFPLGDVPRGVAILTQVLLQVVFFSAYYLARTTRTSTVKAIEDVQQAMRQVAQREAQLLEVRQDLDRALELGGAGRYTDQVLGGYRLGPVIGRGAMAEVYEAHHQTSDQLVAVKLLQPSVAENPQSVARFLREARAAGALSSRHSVRVLAASDGAQPPHYLVMERLHGHDLAYYLRKRRRLPLEQLGRLVAEIGSVVDLASEQGIVHRDIKPQNLFLDQPVDGSPCWKLLDYGVSKLDDDGNLTRGHAVGTPSYMAPEQARGQAVDTRADIYGLAAIAYRCITGQPPFSGRDIPALLYRVVYEMPLRPSLLAAVGPEIDHVLAIGLAKQPTNRFATAAELSAALAAASRGEPDDWLARRAEALLAELPWGASGS